MVQRGLYSCRQRYASSQWSAIVSYDSYASFVLSNLPRASITQYGVFHLLIIALKNSVRFSSAKRNVLVIVVIIVKSSAFSTLRIPRFPTNLVFTSWYDVSHAMGLLGAKFN